MSNFHTLLVSLFSIVMLISIPTLAEEKCYGRYWHGDGPVEIEVTVFEPWQGYVSNASVRFVTLGQKGTETKEDWNTAVAEHVVKGITDLKGRVNLSPILKLHGYDPIEAIDEPCEKSSGYYGGDTYLIIQKEGYHTYSAELSSLNIKTDFPNNDEVTAQITVKLLKKEL